MKKLVLFLSACALLASAVWVGAAGDAGDPLASLSYLNGEFSQRAEKKIDQALEQSDKDLAERLENGEVGEAAATCRRPASRRVTRFTASQAPAFCCWPVAGA